MECPLCGPSDRIRAYLQALKEYGVNNDQEHIHGFVLKDRRVDLKVSDLEAVLADAARVHELDEL